MSNEQKVFRLKEIAERKDAKSAWIIIHNNVYDVTKFLDEVSGVWCVSSAKHVSRFAASPVTVVVSPNVKCFLSL